MGELKIEKPNSKENNQTRNALGRFLSAKAIIGVFGAVFAIAGVTYLSSSMSNSAEAVLKKYLNAKTWEERLKYVRNPELVKPLMSERYKDVDLSAGKPFLRLETEDGKKTRNLKVGDWINIKAVFEEGKNAFGATVQDAAWYVLVLTESDFKIDWEASVIYNPMTFKAMEAQRPTSSQKFRVMAELADYYNYEFRDGQYYLYSIRLHEPDSYQSVYGYIKKDSKDGAKLYEILKDGQKHPMILKIRYPQYSRGSGQVIIDQFVQEYFLEMNPTSSMPNAEADGTENSVVSVSADEVSGIENQIKHIGSSASFKFDVKLISEGTVKDKPFKLVEVKYTYPEAPHPRQCTYVLYHHDQEAGMLTNMIVGSSDYMKGDCNMDSGCFGCGDKSFYQTVVETGYTGKIK